MHLRWTSAEHVQLIHQRVYSTRSNPATVLVSCQHYEALHLARAAIAVFSRPEEQIVGPFPQLVITPFRLQQRGKFPC